MSLGDEQTVSRGPLLETSRVIKRPNQVKVWIGHWILSRPSLILKSPWWASPETEMVVFLCRRRIYAAAGIFIKTVKSHFQVHPSSDWWLSNADVKPTKMAFLQQSLFLVVSTLTTTTTTTMTTTTTIMTTTMTIMTTTMTTTTTTTTTTTMSTTNDVGHKLKNCRRRNKF